VILSARWLFRNGARLEGSGWSGISGGWSQRFGVLVWVGFLNGEKI
jgi:hypothetical protein